MTAAVNGEVINALYIAELAVCGLILMTVVGLMFSFCVRYRAGSTASRANLTEKTWEWEIGWTTATLFLFLIAFVWGVVKWNNSSSEIKALGFSPSKGKTLPATPEQLRLPDDPASIGKPVYTTDPIALQSSVTEHTTHLLEEDNETPPPRA